VDLFVVVAESRLRMPPRREGTQVIFGAVSGDLLGGTGEEPEKQLTRPAELDSVPCAVPVNPWFFGPVCRQLTERRTVDDTYARSSMRMGPNGNDSYEKKKIVDSACRSGILLAGRGGRIRPKCTIQPDGYLPGGFRCLPTLVANQSARLTHRTDDHPTTAAAPGEGRRTRTQPGTPGAAHCSRRAA